LKEAVVNSCPMLEEGPHSKSVCKAASRKGDMGINERNERSYNLDKDRKWKWVRLGIKGEGKAHTPWRQEGKKK
jgi:hypothetical protein